MRRFAVIALLLASVRPAGASPLFELVGDPQGRGGLTARITSQGAAAAYFNPALLADAAPGFELGVFMVSEQIGIDLDGRTESSLCDDGGCNVPDVGGRGPESFRHADSGEPIANPTVPTSWLAVGNGDINARPRQQDGSGQNLRAYQTVGLVAPVLRGRLMLGVFAMVPLGEFTTARSFYNDEREQYFSNSLHPELYGDRLTATSLAFGGGFNVIDDLQVGLTFTLSLANSASAPVYVSNLNDLNTIQIDNDIAVEAAVAPHVGVTWDARSDLRIAGTVHTPQSFEIDTSFDYVLASGIEQHAEMTFTHSYMPLKVAAAALYQLHPELAVTGVAEYSRWSGYRDRHSERPTGDYAWSDTLSAAAGARYHRGDTRGWLDLAYQPSPVPPQTGRTNYVDNDRVGLSAGGDYELVLWGSRFRFGLTLSAHHLLSQHATKFTAPADADPDDYPQLVRDEVPDDSIDALGNPVPIREGLQTNNPGFPGFGSSGWIVGSGVHIAIQY